MDFSALLISIALAHKGQHSRTPQAVTTPPVAEFPKEIVENYIAHVKPIFERSCADCHGNETRFPWYSGLPGAKQLILRDIAEARSHIVISGGFPFRSHGTPQEDLEAIRDSLVAGTMPPLRYRVMHPDARLSEEEKSKVLVWTEQSLRALTRAGKN